MRKWLLLCLVLFVLPLIWWYIQTPIASGVYPEKHAGLVVFEMEEHDRTIDFQLPIQWIKSHPLEKPPVLDNIKLVDEEGNIIASIHGEHRLQVDFERSQWYKRRLRGKIELYLNGKAIKGKGQQALVAFRIPYRNRTY